MKKRGRTEIINDILMAVRDKGPNAKPTHVLYRSNLSSDMLKQYIGSLIEQELIVENSEKSGKTYSLTDKGFTFLREYQGYKSFLESYGLD